MISEHCWAPQAINRGGSFYFVVGLLLIIFSPINFSVLGFLRPADCLLLFLSLWFFLNNPYTSSSVLFFICAFNVALILSAICGLLLSAEVNLRNAAFFYKFNLPFLVFWMYSQMPNRTARAKQFLTAALTVLILLGLWVYVFHMLRHLNLSVLPTRASFPGSTYTDGHMLSLSIGIGILSTFWLSYYRILRIPLTIVFIVIILGIPALMLTGSRTGLFVTVSSIGLWALCESRKWAFMRGTWSTFYLLLATAGAAVLYSWLTRVYSSILPPDLVSVIERAIQFNIAGASEQGRIRKTLMGVSESLENVPFLGVGAFSARNGWYDSGAAILAVYSGLLGLVFFGFLLAWVLIKLRDRSRMNEAARELRCFFWIGFAYAVGNLITEYWLVTRSIVPVSAILGSLAFLISKPQQSLEKK